MQMAQHPLIRLFQHRRTVTPVEEELIVAAFPGKTFREGEELTRANQVNRNLYFITKGILRIVMTNEAGVEVTHFFLRENQFCTIQHSFLNEVPAPESIQAACDVEVLVIRKDALEAIYRQIDWLRPAIETIINQALLEKIRVRNGYLGLDASARYRLFLSQQADIAARVSLHDVATYLGITQQSLSRIRRSKP